MLTTAEAATILQVSRPRVLALIHLGTLKAEKRGRDWQVDEASVEAYKASPRRPGRRWKSEDKSQNRSQSEEDKTKGSPV